MPKNIKIKPNKINTYGSSLDPQNAVPYLSECDQDRNIEITYEMSNFINSTHVVIQISISSNLEMYTQLLEHNTGAIFTI